MRRAEESPFDAARFSGGRGGVLGRGGTAGGLFFSADAIMAARMASVSLEEMFFKGWFVGEYT